MKILPFFALAALATSPALAEETRQLDAHEHGIGQLDIAFEGGKVAMELHAPGADIVGFEYGAESDADLAAIETAITSLSSPLALFAISSAAGCTVVEAHAELESEDSHDDHDEDHDDDHEDEHAHEEDHDDDHDEEEHEDHDDHGDDDHAEEEHDDHDEEEAGHTEFHAEYLLECANPAAIEKIDFAYFATFPNAQEVEVQIVTDTGAASFEVERDAPMLDLRGKL